MILPARCHPVSLLFAAILASPLAGQTPPTPPAPPAPAKAAEEIQVLSPFEVTTTLDTGFVAATSLAGGRLAGDLRDTPAAYSVQTRDFIDALDLSDLNQAIEWTVNATSIDEDGRTTIFGNGVQLSMRGVSAQDRQRNFFPLNVSYDSYNLDRYDYSRGPNAILFGNGGFGGTPNSVTKRALTTRNFGQVAVGAGSWSSLRGTFDYNAVVRPQLAVRVNALKQDGEGWRDFEFEKKQAITLAATWEITPRTSVLIEAERGEFASSRPLAALSDYVSGWDGTTVYADLVNNATAGTTAQQRTAGVSRYGNDTTPVYVFAPDLGMTRIENVANTMRTIGGGTNGVQVGGIAKPANSPNSNFQGLPLWEVANLPPWRFDRVVAGANFTVPGTERTISTTAPTFEQDYETYSAFLRHRIGSRVHLELAVNRASEDRKTNYLNARQLDQVYIDLNRKLPNGRDNPRFLDPFAEGQRSRGSFGNEYEGVRIAAAYEVPENRVGRFLVNFMGGANRQESYQRIESYRVLNPTDPRNWPFDQTVYYRYYLNGENFSMPEIAEAENRGVISPVKWIVDSQRPTDISETSTKFEYLQSAIVGKFFGNRLHTILAARRDDMSVARRINDNYGDYPADWNGSVYYFRPDAPSDYSELPEIRPRDANRRPTVTTGRYQDDFNPELVEVTGTTYSLGAVFHVTDKVSVFANHATGFNPSGSQLRLDGSIMPSPESQGWDAGVRLSLADNRLTLNVSRYTSSETAQPFEISFSANLNNVANANVVGDLSPEGKNVRGMPNVPTQSFDRRDRANEGYEVEIVANLTSNWRISANAAWADASQENAYVDTKAFLAEWGEAMRQIVLDSGGRFNAITNRAEVDVAIPADQRPDSSTATASYNTVFFNFVPNFVDGVQKIPALTEFVANLYTDYELRRGPLKGLRLGAGVNYRGKKVINFRGADTIQDPNQPGNPLATAAIDDPTVDAYSPIYDQPYWLATATLSYSLKLKERRSLRFQLRVSNLLNEDQVVYGTSTTLLPPNGDYVTTAARVSTPTRYRWQTPRSYLFTTTLSF
jgi:outer membrane receptor protein involved in Fe transport